MVNARARRARGPRDLSLSGEQALAFARFWAEYPNRSSKQDAIAAWKRLNPDIALVETIMTAIARQKTWRQWLDGVVPHAATWLNGRRWEDEEPPERATGPGLNGHRAGLRSAGNDEAFAQAKREMAAAARGANGAR